MLAFLIRRRFTLLRVKGSHHFVDDGIVRTTIPVHGNTPLKIGTLRSILRDINMTPTDFSDQFRE